MPALCLLLMWLAQVLPASHIRAKVALPQELCQATGRVQTALLLWERILCAIRTLTPTQVLPVKNPTQALPASHIRARVALLQELRQATGCVQVALLWERILCAIRTLTPTQVLPVKKPAQVLPASHIRAKVALLQKLCQATGCVQANTPFDSSKLFSEEYKKACV